ncbi:uncharacterized protein LOC121384703 isoform X2 [Gigantopelta aegis]|uniref:uncharacterized protein LOC121384703 isoform X2 n=1 Tax=Gigantopelta aegis TaxID=1735272 RepID=UPI001B88DF30|nr:uncharacterized protein LOC121384703 isoform X2 [Gigantopelta aegis]
MYFSCYLCINLLLISMTLFMYIQVKTLRYRNERRMTCLKKFETSKRKTWSQIKKERENQKLHPPCKKPRLSIFNNHNIFASFHHYKTEVGSETEFSDDLPDIDETDSASDSPSPEINSNTCRINNLAAILGTVTSAETRPADVSRVSKPVVFDQNAKAKIAALLTKVQRERCKSDFVTSKSCIQDRSNRHFLDVLNEVTVSETCSTSPSASNSPASGLCSGFQTREGISDCCVNNDDNTDSSCIECHSENTTDEEWEHTKKTVHAFKKCGLLRQVRVPAVESKASSKQCDIKQFFPVAEPQTDLDCTSSVFNKGKKVNLKQNRPMFPRLEVEEECLAASLSDMHINTIEAALEEGDAFLDYSLRLVDDFLLKPTESIVQEITNRGLLGNSCLKVVLKSGKLLSTILQKHPTLLRVEWDVIENLLDLLTMNKNSDSAANLYPKVCLLLDLVCTCFQAELGSIKISNPYKIKKTQAYRLLSSDCAFSNMNKIVQWIRTIVTSDEYKELRDSRLEQQFNHLPAEENIDSVYVPKLLPNLQKLLEIGINVSRSCIEAAKRVGGEMVHTYMYLPDVNHKKLFLQSVSSDLLQFKVVQRILEDNCDVTYVSCEDFPSSLNDVIESYFEALPPKSPMTPPQSPSDEENDPVDARSLSQFSASSCEELAFLVHCVTQSYLRCAQGYQHQPLSQRVRLHQDIRPLCKAVRESESLSVKVSDFYGHLVTLTTELNPATHQYLMLLQSMADASADELDC